MFLEKIMSQLLLSCKEATFLIEKKMVSPLTFTQRLRLGVHLKLCKVCSAYESQSETMNKALEKWVKEGALSKTLPSKIKSDILEKINRK
ncbi:hypothetical protein Q4534_11055 [Cyclobacterium sp. 1_MG-2023]|nr:hypothetical protein [Cyclobacterium sp. 1_MG-2023]